MPSSPGQSDDGTVIVSLPVALSNPHTTCPPDDDRQAAASRDEMRLSDGLRNVTMERAAGRASADHTDTESGAESEGHEDVPKRIHDVDAALLRDTPSPVIPQVEQKEQASQTVSHATTSTHTHIPQSPTDPQRLYPSTTCSYLRPGSKFIGTQQSDRQVYNVQVEIKYVDMSASFICGYLRIQGLTDDHPTLTTYFEGEIIGNKHTFKTAHPEWGSSEKVDMQHWARFPPWRPLAKQAKSQSFSFRNFAQREHLYMRWKEYFLVPDHKVKTITGASFEGFYYICFNQCTGGVSGIYFHAKSEKYQQLELEHVNDRGCMGAIEFR